MSLPVEVRVGSDSDLPKIERAFAALEALGVRFDARVLSAHRTPQRMAARARELEGLMYKVVIAAAGGAAHLPGMTASETLIPVLGIPVETSQLKGMDSLLSIIQMPEGVPVGTVGVAQAEHAALLAAQIAALDDPALRARIRARRGLGGSPAPAREFVALAGPKAEKPCREAMDLLTELGVKDAAVFEAGAVADIEKAGARAIIAWAEVDSLSRPAEIAARTDIPVIAAPLATGPVSSDFLPRLLEKGPVAAMGINRPKNAALFAAMIVGNASPAVRDHLRAHRERLSEEVEKKDGKLRERGLRAYLDDLKK
ncbi:MAG: 5-(carboxyamino)imidazole ribonucleotide mutase [Planctomycetaceae bacterium]|nr:5-(carboxyamino)imidazole ribonucleotide mutase [Planctomycetaceae bacterium]